MTPREAELERLLREMKALLEERYRPSPEPVKLPDGTRQRWRRKPVEVTVETVGETSPFRFKITDPACGDSAFFNEEQLTRLYEQIPEPDRGWKAGLLRAVEIAGRVVPHHDADGCHVSEMTIRAIEREAASPEPAPAEGPKRPKEWDGPRACRQCGGPAPEPRWCYDTPMCYACLPPPPPLPQATPPAPSAAEPPAEEEGAKP